MSTASDDASAGPPLDRLVTESLAKAGMLWIRTPERTWPAWHAFADGTVYVISGPEEQELPAQLPETVTLVLRAKDSRARLLTVPATTERITPDDDEWTAATTALKSGRLNSAVLQPDLVDHWAQRDVVVTALRPEAADAEVGATEDEPSGAAPPLPTRATTR
ncbi:hypothetical protein [Luteipulveratus mongoliensis]|uniref:Pyridoxamine 5'-phosphate oxidase putative domain-containing protein n=1 Tax=Luteipulveratus mongoliensis TaxID=571913 RepID=A0A0K1JLP2_9MICO|nr:hypothetical protein [Luteipulveratus mongoliensis]AKU17631.1 hypothetical protein VV02_20265 [Luteipulveratus mongoliensis]